MNFHKLRFHQFFFALVFIWIVLGCGNNQDIDSGSPIESESGATSSSMKWDEIAPPNLETIQQAKGESLVQAQSQLARFLDRYHRDDTDSVEIAYDINNGLVDLAGNRLSMPAPYWKGIVFYLHDHNTTSAAIRALPESVHKHQDSLGRVKRNAWIYEIIQNNRLLCTRLKTVNGYSG